MSDVNMSLLDKLRLIRQITKSIEYLDPYIEKYGQLFTLDMGRLKLHFINSPQHVKHILEQPWEYHRNDAVIPVVKKILHDYAILTTNNEVIWNHNRKAFIELFQEKYIKNYFNIMIDIINKNLNNWEDYVNKEPLAIYKLMTQLTFDILLKTLFGKVSVDIPYVANLIREASILNKTLSLKIFGFLGWPYYFAIKGNKKKLYAVADSIVEQSLISREKNIVSLLKQYYEGKSGIKEIKNILTCESLGFSFGGQETTTVALVRALVYISQNAAIAQRLHDEVDQVLGKRTPTYEDLSKLVYTQAIIKETLRIEPPLSGMSRKAIKNTRIGNLNIKKGDAIIISSYHLHRLPEYWENPECFNPDRFLKPLTESQNLAYVPFGMGARACIGRYFAMQETILILAMIAQRYTLYLTSKTMLKKEIYSISNKLNMELTMRLHKRTNHVN